LIPSSAVFTGGRIKIVFDGKVEDLLAEVLQIPPSAVTDDLHMKDVDAWDSLKHMELVVSIENNYQIQLSFDEIVSMQSVGEIKRVLRERRPLS
jgi:acyl carrier protein